MVDYKAYVDEDFDIADGSVIIDINTDLGVRQPAIINCNKGKMNVELEFDATNGFGDIIPLTAINTLRTEKLLRIRLTAVEDNTSYKVTAALGDSSFDDNETIYARDIQGNGFTTVGTTAVQLPFTGVTQTIIVTASLDNSGLIYIGKSDVLSDGSNGIDIISPGESFIIDYDDELHPLYVVSNEADQKVMSGTTK